MRKTITEMWNNCLILVKENTDDVHGKCLNGKMRWEETDVGSWEHFYLTQTLVCAHTHVHTHTHTHTHACTHTNMHTHTHTHSLSLSHTHIIYLYTHTDMHTNTYIYTHSHVHIYTHTHISLTPPSFLHPVGFLFSFLPQPFSQWPGRNTHIKFKDKP